MEKNPEYIQLLIRHSMLVKMKDFKTMPEYIESEKKILDFEKNKLTAKEIIHNTRIAFNRSSEIREF